MVVSGFMSAIAMPPHPDLRNCGMLRCKGQYGTMPPYSQLLIPTKRRRTPKDYTMTHLKAVIFGAIGVIAETSDLQRRAFNAAFAEAKVDWSWDEATYRDLLSINGGQNRLRYYRNVNPEQQSISDELIIELHSAKTRCYGQMLTHGTLSPRAGVAALIAECGAAGIRTALCTSTSRANVDAIATGLGKQLNFDAFETVITIDKIEAVKPAPDAYFRCLADLGLAADEVIAIEDTPVSMAAARAAGIKVIATPGEMTRDQDFSGAVLEVPSLGSLSLQDIMNII
jgi:HAD superfamily hydrolase (TIGR01509 family)